MQAKLSKTALRLLLRENKQVDGFHFLISHIPKLFCHVLQWCLRSGSRSIAGSGFASALGGMQTDIVIGRRCRPPCLLMTQIGENLSVLEQQQALQ